MNRASNAATIAAENTESDAIAEPTQRRWSRRSSVLAIAGLSLLGWALIAAAVMSLLDL